MDNYTKLTCKYAYKTNNMLFNRRFGMKKPVDFDTIFFIQQSLKALKDDFLTSSEKQLLLDNLKLISNE